MASIKRFVGNVPFSRALRFTTKHPQFSRYTKTKRAGPLSIPTEVPAELGSLLSGAKLADRAKERREAWRRMINLSKELGEYSGGRPTTTQAIAALAMSRGMERDKLLKDAKSLVTLNNRMRRHKRPIFADKTGSRAIFAINKDALRTISGLLEKSMEPLTVSDLMKKTGLSRPVLGKTLLILRDMRLVIQLPQETSGSGGQNYRWVSVEKRMSPQTRPKTNAAYNVILALEKGEAPLSRIIHTEKGFLKRNFVGGVRHDITAVKSILSNLIKQGIVEYETKRFGEAFHRIAVYRLTPEGRVLLAEQKKREYIHPNMRRVLMGEPLSGINLSEQQRLKKMIDYISIKLEYTKKPRKMRVEYGAIGEIAKKYGVSPTMVKMIARLKKVPWGRVSFEKLKFVYLPEMYKVAPEQAEWFEKFLAQNEDKFKKRKNGMKRIKKVIMPRELFDKWKPMALGLARRRWELNQHEFVRLSMGIEDVRQEAILLLQKAANTHDGTYSFSTFATKVINNGLGNIVKGARTQKRTAEIVSLDAEITSTGSRMEEGEALIDMIAANRDNSIEKKDARIELLRIINGLTMISPRDKLFFISRYGLEDDNPKGLVDAMRPFGIKSVSRAHEIDVRIRRKLRQLPRVKDLFRALE